MANPNDIHRYSINTDRHISFRHISSIQTDRRTDRQTCTHTHTHTHTHTDRQTDRQTDACLGILTQDLHDSTTERASAQRKSAREREGEREGGREGEERRLESLTRLARLYKLLVEIMQWETLCEKTLKGLGVKVQFLELGLGFEVWGLGSEV